MNNSLSVYIGAADSVNERMAGSIDEVAVYGTALSAARVLAHYNASSGGGTTEPVTLDGAILRVDPVTGNAFAGNPFAASSDPNKRRIIAYGLRNPFRFDVRPGTNELWVGDVGWSSWEEINRVANIGDATVENFGWPCYEGSGRQSGYDAANLPICETLYQASGDVTAPTTPTAIPQALCQATAVRPVARRPQASRSIPIRWNVSGDVPGRALLRGLHPELHLVDGQGCRRPARSRHASCFVTLPPGPSTWK